MEYAPTTRCYDQLSVGTAQALSGDDSGSRSVLNPFCGRGTTIYAAQLAGVPAVGVDVNPLAVAIARAKLARASLASVLGLAQTLLSEAAGEVPQGEFWRWCFYSDTLREIVTLRHKLLCIKDTPASELLRAVIWACCVGHEMLASLHICRIRCRELMPRSPAMR